MKHKTTLDSDIRLLDGRLRRIENALDASKGREELIRLDAIEHTLKGQKELLRSQLNAIESQSELLSALAENKRLKGN